MYRHGKLVGFAGGEWQFYHYSFCHGKFYLWIKLYRCRWHCFGAGDLDCYCRRADADGRRGGVWTTLAGPADTVR